MSKIQALNIYFLTGVFIAALQWNCSTLAEAAATPLLLLKKVELDSEPTNVFLLEEYSGNKLKSLDLSFKVIKTQMEGSKDKYTVTAAALPTNDVKPLALLFLSNKAELESGEASASLIEKTDLVDATVIDNLRTKILELRLQSSELQKKLNASEEQVNVLKAKAAALARINRLVEAQTTVASLSRRLEDLVNDKANVSLLLDIVRQEQSSARLASSEAALSRDLRLLSQEGAGAKKQKGLLLSEAQRESAQKIIEKAKGLNLESLRHKAQASYASNVDREVEGEMVESPKALAAEYNRKHKKSGY